MLEISHVRLFSGSTPSSAAFGNVGNLFMSKAVFGLAWLGLLLTQLVSSAGRETLLPRRKKTTGFVLLFVCLLRYG